MWYLRYRIRPYGPNQRHQCRGGRCLNGAAHVALCRPGAGDVARCGPCAANVASLARWIAWHVGAVAARGGAGLAFPMKRKHKPLKEKSHRGGNRTVGSLRHLFFTKTSHLSRAWLLAF